MNILGNDGGYAPIAPGPIDSARRKIRDQFTKKVKKTHTTIVLTPFYISATQKSHGKHIHSH